VFQQQQQQLLHQYSVFFLIFTVSHLVCDKWLCANIYYFVIISCELIKIFLRNTIRNQQLQQQQEEVEGWRKYFGDVKKTKTSDKNQLNLKFLLLL